MNPIKKSTFALAALAVIGVAQAQQSSTPIETTPVYSPADRPGVLGQNYTDLNFGLEDLRHTSDNAYDANLRANVPIRQGIDVGLGYGYHWQDSDSKIHNHLLATDAKFYVPLDNYMKPYVGTLVGYQWVKTELDNQTPFITTRDNRWVWGLSTGVEIPVGTVAITPRVDYLDTMDNNSIGNYRYGVEAHHWFSRTLGGYADVDYNELRHQANTWTYTAGMRFKF